MKNLLRGMVAGGLLTGGALAMSCRDERPETGTYNTPIQDKYQPPEAEAREPLGEEWMNHPSDEPDEQDRRLGGGESDTEAGEDR